MRIAVCFKNNTLGQKIASNCIYVTKHECVPVNFSKMSNRNTILKHITGFDMIIVNALDFDIIETLKQLGIKYSVYNNIIKKDYDSNINIVNLGRYELSLNVLLRQFNFRVEYYIVNNQGYPVKVFEERNRGVEYDTYKEALDNAISIKISDIDYYNLKLSEVEKQIVRATNVLNELLELQKCLGE